MGIVIGLESRQLDLPGEEIVIGKSPTAQLSIPGDARLADRHAVLRQVAGRWLIEAQSDAAIRVGDGRPTKLAWLNPGDVIHLTEQGPKLTFSPSPGGVAAPAPSIPFAPTKPAAAIPTTPAVSAPKSSAPDSDEIVIPPDFYEKIEPVDEPEPKIRRRKSADRPEPKLAPAAEPIVVPKNLQAAMGAVVAVSAVLLLVSMGALWMGQRASRVISPPSVPNNLVATVPAQTQPSSSPAPQPATTPNPEPIAKPDVPAVPISPEQLSAAVYRVLLSAPNRDLTYRLGSAWAVDKRKLVTSGAIAQGIRDLQEQLPTAVVQDAKKSASINVTRSQVHPEFARLAKIATEAQDELNQLRSELEDSKDEAQIEELKPKMTAVQNRLLDALQEQLDYDLGILEVDRDLTAILPVISDPAAVRSGTTVRLMGIPFPMDEFLVDPDAPISVALRAGQIQAKVPENAAGVRRWLVKFREVKLGDNWSGAACVNSRGEVIGVYSRPTPPTELREDYVPATHEITVISRLADIK